MTMKKEGENMRNRIWVMSLAVIALGMFAIARAADQKPNLNGTWKLNVAKSDFGQFPPPENRTDVIEQTGDKFKIKVTMDIMGGKNEWGMTFTADGQEVTVPPDSPAAHMGPVTLQKIKAAWEGSNLVINTHTDFQGNGGTWKTVYTLSPDGKVLTSAGHMTADGGGFEMDVKAVFDKQ